MNSFITYYYSFSISYCGLYLLYIDRYIAPITCFNSCKANELFPPLHKFSWSPNLFKSTIANVSISLYLPDWLIIYDKVISLILSFKYTLSTKSILPTEILLLSPINKPVMER